MVLDKKELDRSIHLLEGLLKGIAFDQTINTKEIDELNHWITSHDVFRRHYPYTVLIPLLSTALADKIITESEKQDILWFCEKVWTENFFFDIVFSDLQRLQGIIHGILSDKIIRDEEVYSLEGWLKEHQHLKSHYPYDELVVIIDRILEDKRISTRERQTLERYFIEFIDNKLLSAYTEEELSLIRTRMTIGAVCAKEPVIEFRNRTFSFTGEMTKRDKETFIDCIKNKGGYYTPVISENVDYLVVNDASALLWAFEPFGRKIDKALKLRAQGEALVIISKRDFIDAFK